MSDPPSANKVILEKEHFFQGFSVTIDENAVFRLQGYLKPEDKPDQRVLDLYYDTLIEAEKYFEPHGLLVFKPVIRHESTQIVLEENLNLIGQNIVRTFRGASFIGVGLVTIGHKLEKMVKKHFDDTELARGLMLDSIGSEAAEAAAIFIDDTITRMIERLEWRRTPRMSPGYGSFDISEQKKIFSLLNSDKVGVNLTSSCIMTPQKSISFLVGCGPHVRHFDTLSPCRVCDAKDCPVRDLHSIRCNQ